MRGHRLVFPAGEAVAALALPDMKIAALFIHLERH